MHALILNKKHSCNLLVTVVLQDLRKKSFTKAVLRRANFSKSDLTGVHACSHSSRSSSSILVAAASQQ
jgi:uncharacterized protein YjbI with pentapeptide repeats